MKRLRALRVAAALLALLAAGGCAAPLGKDFVRPTAATVELGRTTPQEIRARYGEPRSERSWTRGDLDLAKEVGTPFGAPRVPGSMTEMYYYFADRGADAAVPGVEPARSARYWFWNGKLAGFLSSSSFKSDSTVFDDGKVAAIKPWQSLRADLLSALGEPSGMRAYPLAPREDMQVLTWFAFEWDRDAGQSRASTLHVLVDGIGVVVDLRYNREAKPLPPPPAPAYTPVPIYIPRGKR